MDRDEGPPPVCEIPFVPVIKEPPRGCVSPWGFFALTFMHPLTTRPEPFTCALMLWDSLLLHRSLINCA